MVGTKPRIWFERPLLADLVGEVERVAEILGASAATLEDPLVGLDAAEGAVVGRLTYDAALLDRASAVKVICRTGIGYDEVDVAEATRRGIAVCNAPDGPTVSTAEHAVTLMLAAAKHVKRSEQWLHDGQTEMYARHQAIELDEKVLGLVGFGRIARRVATAAHGLGMGTMAYDPFIDSGDFASTTRAGSLDELLGASDIVSVHIPMTAGNARLFDAGAFDAMKTGAVFVNTARGGLVDQEALISALDSGHLHSAGLDVTDPEPLPPDHPLLQRDDVLVTPHVASGTHDGKRRTFRRALEQAVQVLGGQRPDHLVNPEAWDSVVARLGAR